MTYLIVDDTVATCPSLEMRCDILNASVAPIGGNVLSDGGGCSFICWLLVYFILQFKLSRPSCQWGFNLRLLCRTFPRLR